MTNYPMTTFYVKNTSDKVQNFKASIMKQSSMGPFEMTLPFAVHLMIASLPDELDFAKKHHQQRGFQNLLFSLPTV